MSHLAGSIDRQPDAIDDASRALDALRLLASPSRPAITPEVAIVPKSQSRRRTDSISGQVSEGRAALSLRGSFQERKPVSKGIYASHAGIGIYSSSTAKNAKNKRSPRGKEEPSRGSIASGRTSQPSSPRRHPVASPSTPSIRHKSTPTKPDVKAVAKKTSKTASTYLVETQITSLRSHTRIQQEAIKALESRLRRNEYLLLALCVALVVIVLLR